jgi:hypothetical protein
MQSMCVEGASYRLMLHPFDAVLLDGDDVLESLYQVLGISPGLGIRVRSFAERRRS